MPVAAGGICGRGGNSGGSGDFLLRAMRGGPCGLDGGGCRADDPLPAGYYEKMAVRAAVFLSAGRKKFLLILVKQMFAI